MKVTALMSINRCTDSRFCKSSSLLQSWLGWKERVFVYPWFWPCPTACGALLAQSKPKVESSTRKTRCCVCLGIAKQQAGVFLPRPSHHCVAPGSFWAPPSRRGVSASVQDPSPSWLRCSPLFSSCHRNRRRPLKHRGGVHV